MIPAYSVAKTATAAAVLTAGLDLDSPVGRYAPAPRVLADLSVRDLLAHRSGLGDYAAWPDYHEAVEARTDAWPADEVLARAAATPLGSRGGFRYSNVGYLLLRRALEEHDGAPLHDVLLARVLGPLGVEAAPFASRSDWDRVTGPVDDGLRGYDPGWVYPGTFLSTPDGLIRLVVGVLRGVLGPSVAAQMTDGLPLEAPGHPLPDPGYGLGLMVSGRPARFVGHGGGGPGFTITVLAAADGTRAHARVEPGGVDDRPLWQACLDDLTRVA